MQYPMVMSPQWLYDNLGNPEISVIETSWVSDSYTKAHITGAFCAPYHPYLKRNDATGKRTQYVMKAVDFLHLCHSLGLRKNKHYVLYDDYYGLFAARFWYVCRYFGLNNFSILDGSWKGWLAQEKPVSSQLEIPSAGSDINVVPQERYIIGRLELESIFANPGIQLWDTRSYGEYSGQDKTDNKRRGHIPGSINLVWTDLLTEAETDGDPRYLKSVVELEQILDHSGLQRDKMIITYCQSGIRAAFCNFVLELLGFPQHRLYDASMGEWANLDNTELRLEQ